MKPKQQSVWKDIVAVFSAMIFVLVPGIIAMYFAMELLDKGSTEGSVVFWVAFALLAMTLGLLIGQIIWMYVMSYFLDIKSYDRWINLRPTYIPIVTNVCMNAYRHFRQKKIEREERG